MKNLLRPNLKLLELDDAVEWNQLLSQFRRSHFSDNVSKWDRKNDRFQRVSNKERFVFCMNIQGDIRYMCALQGHFTDLVVDVGCSLEEQVEIGDDKHFFTAVDPMCERSSII